MNKKGLLLVNLGTPDSPHPDDVKAYLKEFLSDTNVIQMPRLLWQPILRGKILPKRSFKSAELYQKNLAKRRFAINGLCEKTS